LHTDEEIRNRYHLHLLPETKTWVAVKQNRNPTSSTSG
jgi:hypothetical protein